MLNKYKNTKIMNRKEVLKLETAQTLKIKMQLKLIKTMQKAINENLIKISKQLKK